MTTPSPKPLALVLIVDDDPLFRDLSRASLEQDELRIEEVSSGEAAIKFASCVMPDLIVLDLQMPGMGGYATCQAIRQLPQGEFVPILMMTGVEDVASIAKAYDVGATDFIIKPCNGLILNQRVRYMLRASQNLHVLRNNEARLAQAQRIAQLGGWEWDLSLEQIELSDAACHILGIPPETFDRTLESYLACVHEADRPLVNETMRKALLEGTSFALDHRTIRTDITEHTIHLQGEALINESGYTHRILGTVQDITDKRATESTIDFLKNYDGRTHLPNRNFLLHRVTQAATSVIETTGTSALFVLSVDRFHRICEMYGSSVGHQIIKELSTRLHQAFATDEAYLPFGGPNVPMIAYLGESQLAVLLTNLSGAEDSAKFAQRCLDALGKPFQIGSASVTLSAQIGIAIPGSDGEDAEQLLRHAETALQAAKHNGPAGFQYYSDSLNTMITARIGLEQDLRTAMSRNQFLLHYQPKVDILSEEVIGFEALLRWQHPTRGIIAPAEFISIAEENGIITEISEWVIQSVVQQQRVWHRAGLAPATVSVNLSGLQFRQRHFADRIKSLVYAEGGNPQDIELELTENVLMADAALTMATLEELNASGFRVTIDDFGTGYSSLAYLPQFRIDTLKINQAFVKDLKVGKTDSPIVRAMIGMGRALQLNIVAEGVETRDQLTFLRMQGCSAYQGYLFSKPVPASQIQPLMRDRTFEEVSKTAERVRKRRAG